MQWKSLHQLRSVAQGLGVADIFSKTEAQLKQEIEIKQRSLFAPETPLPVKPMYDARLMSKPPARISSVSELDVLLEPYKARGLHVHYDNERWYMQWDKRTDEGPLRMPMRSILKCAETLLK